MCKLCLDRQVQGGTHLSPDTPVASADWEEYLDATAKRILDEQSPQRLLEVRGRLYELITHCIPSGVIIKSLTKVRLHVVYCMYLICSINILWLHLFAII